MRVEKQTLCLCLLNLLPIIPTFADDDVWAKQMERAHQATDARDLESEKTEYTKAVEESKAFPPGDVRKADSMFGLGKVFIGLHNFDQASELLQKAADIYKVQFGPKSKEYARVLADLATAQIRLGKRERGEALAYEASSINQLCGLSTQTIASEFNNRACDFMAISDWQRAIRLLDQAIAIAPQYELAYKNRSTAKFSSGDKKGAEVDDQTVDELRQKQK